jgi:KUP system potassium uptake protein
LIPVVIVTIAATIIASQAVISGAFALVQQAIQLGALPRLDVRQTSDEQIGQVYVPQINWLLAVAVIGLVPGFRSSDALANAYGIAVAGDMLVTTLLVTVVAFEVWSWPRLAIIVVAIFFLALDITFVSANVHKIPAGGWFPLVVGALTLTLMLSWLRGRAVAFERKEEGAVSIDAFVKRMNSLQRVAGVAVYLDHSP